MPTEPGNRLLTLRHLLKLSQAELAASTGISQAQISLMERGERSLSNSAMVRIAAATETPITFFEVEAVPVLGALSFRKMSSAGARDVVTARFNEIERIANSLGDLVNFPAPELPKAKDALDRDGLEYLAAKTRSALGIEHERAILNLTRTMERKGVVVAPIAARSEELFDKHDGISRPSEQLSRPLITYVSGGAGDRERFTKAHELGHLVLHRYRPFVEEKTKEKEANRFAGALLLPRSAVEAEVGESLTLNGYLKLKAQWGVSAQAIIARAYDLHLISESRRKSLMVQMSYKGWRKTEPVLVRPEAPILLRQMLSRQFGSSPYMKASHALGVAPHFLRLWAPGAPEDTPPSGYDSDSTIENVVELFPRDRRRSNQPIGRKESTDAGSLGVNSLTP